MASSVDGCERLLRALAPDFEPVELESLEELEVGIAWLDQAEPLVHQRVDEVAALFPRRRELALPLAPANRADFMREVADVHRGTLPGQRAAVRRERPRQGRALPAGTRRGGHRGRA